MRSIAAASGATSSLACGPRRLLRIAHAAHMHAVRLNEEQNLVLAGLRRNGMLSFRPRLSEKRLVRSDTQALCRGLPEGSHRYPKEWLRDRYSWQDEDGKPLAPSWAKCGPGVETAEGMEDATGLRAARSARTVGKPALRNPRSFSRSTLRTSMPSSRPRS